MSDEFDRSEFEREERAFADGLRDALEGEAFRPLDPASITSVAPRRNRPWGRVLAAAAVVVVVGGVGVLLPQLFRAQTASTAASGSAAAAPEGVSGAAAPEDKNTDAAPVPASSRQAEFTAQDWVTTTAWPLSSREDVSATFADGRFFVVGGRTPSTCPRGAACPMVPNDKVDGASYDPDSNTWASVPDSPIVVDRTPPVEVNGSLYYLGRDSSGARAMAAFDVSANSWRAWPAPRIASELVAAGEVVVAISSSSGAGVLDQVFDPAVGAWTDLPRDPLGTSDARSGLWVGGRLVLVSREVKRSADEPGSVGVALLDPASRTWSRVKSVPVDAYDPVVVDGRIVWTQPIIRPPKDGKASNQVVWVDSSGGTGGTVERPKQVGGLDGVDRVVAGSRVGVAGVNGLDGHLYDFATGRWELLAAPPLGNVSGQTVVGSPDGLLVVGGAGEGVTAGTYYLPLR